MVFTKRKERQGILKLDFGTAASRKEKYNISSPRCYISLMLWLWNFLRKLPLRSHLQRRDQGLLLEQRWDLRTWLEQKQGQPCSWQMDFLPNVPSCTAGRVWHSSVTHTCAGNQPTNRPRGGESSGHPPRKCLGSYTSGSSQRETAVEKTSIWKQPGNADVLVESGKGPHHPQGYISNCHPPMTPFPPTPSSWPL